MPASSAEPRSCRPAQSPYRPSAPSAASERQQRISHVERRRRTQPRDQRGDGNGREQCRRDGQRLAPGGEQESGQRRQLEREHRDDRGDG